MGLFFYTKIGSIIFIGDLPTTNIIEPYIQGRKNKDKQRQDDGSDSMINGAYLAVASAGIASAIIAALSQLKF